MGQPKYAVTTRFNYVLFLTSSRNHDHTELKNPASAAAMIFNLYFQAVLKEARNKLSLVSLLPGDN
jgi:hypothetical protein